MEIHHTPVLAREIVNFIGATSDNVKVIDATVGEGGHSALFLERGWTVFAVDRDEDMVAKARERLKAFSRVSFALCTYDGIYDVLPEEWIGTTDALLFDLGVSMYHFRTAQRGFSFREDGPLDMRLSRTGKTAHDVVNGYTEDELARVIRDFGEVPYAGRIAQAIVTARRTREIGTTAELEAVVFHATPKKLRFGRIHPATRVFQAIRIEVNDELMILSNALTNAFRVLAPEGVLAVISYHSLEDRIVKRFMNENDTRHGTGRLTVLTRHVVTAQAEETATNPAARSAKLRVARMCPVK
ncbi:MAG: 16S rRNA (cytosine(1402)-N(4))-methyltransferase RsmH [Spirochaetota bacterium]